MSQSSFIARGPPPKIDKTTFIVSRSITLETHLQQLLTASRVRIRVFGRLHSDDALVFFAWVLLLTNAALWQTGKDALYQTMAVSAGQLFPPPADFTHQSEQYLRKSVAVIIFFYTGLWSIKLAFLLFFKRLGHNVKNQNVVWWTVLVITAASYFACLGDIDYHCLTSSFAWISSKHPAFYDFLLIIDHF